MSVTSFASDCDLNAMNQVPEGPMLNVGCGPVQPEGWVNIDGSNRAWLASRLPWLDELAVRLKLIPPTEYGPQIKWMNLLNGIRYEDNSVAGIYAGEVWEHLEYQQAAAVTRHCFRVLKPRGVLRVCVPDGVVFWRRYLEMYEEEANKPESERDEKRLRDWIQVYFNEIITRRLWFHSVGYSHKWQYDDIQLIHLFREAGFIEVARMPFHESRIGGIDKVERSDFLIVEGVKPPNRC